MSKRETPPRKKVGRNWYVCDRQGKIVEGLAYDTGNGYYFYSGWRQEPGVKQKKKTRKDYQFGRDYDEAIYLFRQWQEKDKSFSPINYDSVMENGGLIHTPDDAPKGSEIVEEYDEDGFLSAYAIQHEIDDDEVWRRARSLILQDIREAAKKLGFPCLLEIEDKLLKHREIPKLTIQNIRDFFWDHNGSKPQEKRMVRLAINEFMEYVKDSDVSSMDKFDVMAWNEFLHSDGHSSNFINKRIERVITCLNFYLKNFEKKKRQENQHKAEIKRTVDLIKEHTDKKSAQIKDTPKTFSVKTLKKLFKKINNDRQFVLINLLALNCGFYAKDIEGIKKDMVREKDGLTFISYPRDKTQKTSPRVIVLWEKTTSLLQDYMNDNPNNTDYVFLNKAGTNLKVPSIQKKFRQYKAKVKNEDKTDINFKSYRDTVASSLVYKVDNTDLITVTLGHDFGGKKKMYWKYIETNPSEIKVVADILYDKFKAVIDAI
ncbi:site-specific tyrosine recombinase XerC [Anaerohalosphaera lusitana]|uniref:Site-specific tyrosine recombinase XerC n=1 Tax=Anaerohalosphaera lusitana TaxID=1936003 RepID=A0A1U9NJV6_9BACT|nr:tyrosine-type recombinase/integrase [Anaerohalosphaera lusitana]AQT68223.1 site-specific tyrosine recombinase XerC [Anaerohalosphaera lusitana]